MTSKDLSIISYALRSEEEAYDMYTEMIKQATDKELIRVLKHNRKEEKEHIKMLEKFFGDMNE